VNVVDLTVALLFYPEKKETSPNMESTPISLMKVLDVL
jgi:hypothetical protein